ncbi:hypothetical protein BDV93DRAFT_511377 [Ceratobasidium sp. AG-I]|nr:hypothetical protein BDV93DRAFT_511377 [Ceratobasidium sp. AG-I]
MLSAEISADESRTYHATFRLLLLPPNHDQRFLRSSKFGSKALYPGYIYATCILPGNNQRHGTDQFSPHCHKHLDEHWQKLTNACDVPATPQGSLTLPAAVVWKRSWSVARMARQTNVALKNSDACTSSLLAASKFPCKSEGEPRETRAWNDLHLRILPIIRRQTLK